MQYMVHAVVIPDLFDAHDVFGLFHDADCVMIPARVGTDGTGILLREITADGTEFQGASGFNERFGKLSDFLLRQIQYMQSQALRGFIADSGELGKLIDEFLNRCWVKIHD